MDIFDAAKLTEVQIADLPLEVRVNMAEELVAFRTDYKRNNQLLLYEAASPDARKIHFSTAKEICVSGGNRSSKTETCIVEGLIQGYGIVPYSLQGDYRWKAHLPEQGHSIRIRMVIKNLVTVLEPILKPKLQWWKWNGQEPEGGDDGHWGWVSPAMLIDGSWDKSWSEKNRTLTLSNGTTIQIMSHDQDPEDFSGGSFHLIIHDEGPPHAIYRENRMRTLDTRGQLLMAMTPPDEEGAAWDAAWVYDELYEKGQPGPGRDPDIESFTLFTESNRTLSQDEVSRVSKGLSDSEREVRLHGRFLHLTGRIYSLYSDRMQMWCFGCNGIIYGIGKQDECSKCKSFDLVEFKHFVEPFPQAYSWPTAMFLDPHPRKPNCIAWFAYAPAGDIYQIHELEIDESPQFTKKRIWEIESDLHMHVHRRLMDPNMGLSPSSSAKAANNRTVQQEFDKAGLRCGLADDNRETARSILKEMMKPEQRVGAPSFHVFSSCKKTNHQYLRYSWDEWTRYSSEKRDPKPKPREKEDDFPVLGGYMANAKFTHDKLKFGGQVLRRRELTESGRRPDFSRPSGRSDQRDPTATQPRRS